MPTYKGIKINIISQWELRIHTEFPHPESSQFTNRSPDARDSSTFPDFTPKGISPDSKADKLLGRQSSVSVYIPSLPGTRFWLRYSVFDVQPKTIPWYYFKLYVNGRHITSWGTNTGKKPNGQVMRALCDPSERWNYKQDGVVYKNNGTESRYFFFAAEEEEGARSLADDGGLIEVHAFRAKGRQRKLPQPVEYKPREQYGIYMPTAGLLEKPQEAKFYDWHLKDPKDSPFATFKFHYRSWESLRTLHLIPHDHPRQLLPPSPSILSLNGQKVFEEQLKGHETPVIPADEVKLHSPIEQSPRSLRDSLSSNNSATPWMTDVFDDSPLGSAENLNKRSGLRFPRSSMSPRGPQGKIPLSEFSQAALEKSPSSGQLQPEILDRPLPEIPIRLASLKHSRNTSEASGAPSIAPSLVKYIDRDTTSPPPVIGVAVCVAIGRDVPKPVEIEDTEEGAGNEIRVAVEGGTDMRESLELKPPPLSISKRKGVASPPLSGFFSMPNITLRKNRKSAFKALPRLKTSPNVNKYGELPGPEEEEDMRDNTPTLSISESEWMCRTPSPIPDQSRFGKLWSPGVDKRKNSIKAGGSLRKKALNWYESVRSSTEPEDTSAFSLGEDEAKITDGENWI